MRREAEESRWRAEEAARQEEECRRRAEEEGVARLADEHCKQEEACKLREAEMERKQQDEIKRRQVSVVLC